MEATSDTLNWREGRRITPPADAPVADDSAFAAFTLGRRIGEFFPETGKEWSLQIQGLEDSAILAHGCELRTASGTLHHVYCPASGILCGESAHAADVALNSTTHGIRRDGAESSIRMGRRAVAFRIEQHPGRTRWALVSVTGDEHTALVHARAALHTDTRAAWEALVTRRAELLARAGCDDRLRPALAESIELMLGSVRAPEGAIAGTWLDTSGSPSGIEPGRAAACLPALAQLDLAAASRVLDTLLQMRDTDGILPALATPDGTPRKNFVPPPFIAQAALALWRTHRDLETAQGLLSALVPVVTAQLEHYESVKPGVCRWHTAAESLTPELHDEGLATPDIATLLLAETDAVLELAAPFPTLAPLVRPLATRRARLLTALAEFYPDPETSRFRSRYIEDARPIKRTTAADILPLLAAPLTAAQRDAMVALVARDGELRSEIGIASWARWEGDADEAPVTPIIQILILRALRRTGLVALANEITADLVRFYSRQTLTHPLTIEDAALVVHLAYGDALAAVSTGREKVSLQGWLDRQRTGLIVAAAVLALGLATVLAWPVFFPKADETSANARLGLAQLRGTEGDLAAAAAIYEELLDSPLREAGQVDFLLGNIRAKQGGWAQAEVAYRAGLQRQPDQPRAWMNLALAQFKQRKLADAEKTYRDFITRYATYYPDLAARAQTALELIAEQRR